MSFASEHTLKVVLAKYSRGGTEYSFLDDAFGISSMLLFQPHDDLMGSSKFDDTQILVGYVRSDGVLHRTARQVGYALPESTAVVFHLKNRLRKLNGETAYRIIRAVNRAKAVQMGRDTDLWRQEAHFEPTPVLNAYIQEQMATGTGPVQYANRMGGPNAARDVFKAALRISKRSATKNSAAHRKHVVTTALEISDSKYEELLSEYHLREFSN
jgi:hypothetical protein